MKRIRIFRLKRPYGWTWAVEFPPEIDAQLSFQGPHCSFESVREALEWALPIAANYG